MSAAFNHQNCWRPLAFAIASLVICWFLYTFDQPTPAVAESPEPFRPDKLDYNFHIRPILADRCLVCHGPDKGTRKADLRLDVRAVAIDEAGVIVPGKPTESELIRRITSTDPDERMPPRASKLQLTDDEVAPTHSLGQGRRRIQAALGVPPAATVDRAASGQEQRLARQSDRPFRSRGA